MTTGGIGGYSDDTVAARLSIDVPASAIGTVKELALYTSQIQQNMEAAARFTSDYMSYLNNFPTIQRQVLDLQREQLQTLRDTQAVMSSMRAMGVSTPQGPTTQYYGQQGVGMPSSAYPGGFSGTDRYQSGRETPAAAETSQNRSEHERETDAEQTEEAARHGNRIQRERERHAGYVPLDSHGNPISPRSIPSSQGGFGVPGAGYDPREYPTTGYGPGYGLPGSPANPRVLLDHRGRPIRVPGDVPETPSGPMGPHQSPEAYNDGMSEEARQAAIRRRDEMEYQRYMRERASLPGGGAPDTSVPGTPDPNDTTGNPGTPGSGGQGGNPNDQSRRGGGFGWDNFSQGLAQGIGQTITATSPGGAPIGARLLTTANLLRNIGSTNSRLFAPATAPHPGSAPVPGIPGIPHNANGVGGRAPVPGIPGVPASPGTPAGALSQYGSAVRGLGYAGMAVGAAGLAWNAVQAGGESLQGFKNQDLHGNTISGGLEVQKDVLLMSMNPMLTMEQSRSIIMGAMKSGYTGKSYDSAVEFIKGNLLDMNVEVSKSISLLRSNVQLGNEDISKIKMDIADAQSYSKNGSLTGEQIVANYTEFSEFLTSKAGAEGASTAASLFATQYNTSDGKPDPIADQMKTNNIAALQSAPVQAFLTANSGLGGNPGDIVSRLNDITTEDDPVLLEQLDKYYGYTAKQLGYNPLIFQQVMNSSGIPMDFGTAKDLVQRMKDDAASGDSQTQRNITQRDSALEATIGNVGLSELRDAGITNEQIKTLSQGDAGGGGQGRLDNVRSQISAQLEASGQQDLLGRIDWDKIESDGYKSWGEDYSALKSDGIANLAKGQEGAVFAVDPDGNYYPISEDPAANNPSVVLGLSDPNSGWTVEKQMNGLANFYASQNQGDMLNSEDSATLSKLPRTVRKGFIEGKTAIGAASTPKDLSAPDASGQVEGDLVKTASSKMEKFRSFLISEGQDTSEIDNLIRQSGSMPGGDENATGKFDLTPEAKRLLVYMPGSVPTDPNTQAANKGLNGATRNGGG